ncbi:DUF4209 domain-containing protein [Micromonospora sp. C97]|uniref:DUF4209 domain-containing protein n=1 Tax=Micromonospora sp. C97 TaxID=2824883 RepID=UPI001B394116|nr:DUF4209 domain-containing protein [Micromonospora sp. C97]MBQ1028933.1 DUF4209 domain-containing protein [Micromonospora sp. C97]
MTNTAPPGDTAAEPIDPAWWAAALGDDSSDAGPSLDHLQLSIDLTRLKAQAESEVGKEGIRTRVLDVLAKATSPMLVPENWNEPYVPVFQFGEGRSVAPSDLEDADLQLLARLVPLIEAPALRARVADIAWTYGNRGERELLATAVESYRAHPLDHGTWYHLGRDSWRRALELSLRCGMPGRPAVEAIAADLVGFLRVEDAGAGFMLTEVAALLALIRPTARTHAREVADRFVVVAADVSGNHRLQRAYERAAADWFMRSGETELAHACVHRVALAYVEEAAERLREDRGALTVGVFLEKAVATLRGIPRAYRAAHGLDALLAQLREQLRDARELTLEQMVRIQSDPIDIARYIEQTQRAVTGKSRFEALVTLAGFLPISDPAALMADGRSQLQGSLSRLFGSSTFSADARKVATRNGSGTETITDDEVFAHVVRSFTWRIGLLTQAVIHPALEMLLLEHRFDLAFLAEICTDSPLVPPEREYLWARGLWHGLSGDFPSAIALLVPQVEQLLRHHFKTHGVFTLFVDDHGIESEKSISALLEMPDAERLLGAGWTLELRALLCEQLGPNLRNELAHGLLTDAQAWGTAAVYAWWLCLRLVLLPYLHTGTGPPPERADPTEPGENQQRP